MPAMLAYTLGWLLLPGCGPAAVGGTVDGEEVGGARDAIYDRIAFGPLEYTIVVVSDYRDSCEVTDAFLDAFAFDCEERCEEYVAIVDAYDLDHDSYWNLSFTLNTSDLQEGVFDHDEGLADEEFVASFVRWDATPMRDVAACEEACEEGELLVGDEELAEGGTVEIVDVDESSIEGTFEVALGGADGLEGRFLAEPCDLESWLGL